MSMHQVMVELGVIWDVDPALIQNHFLCMCPLIGAEFPHVQGPQGLHHWVVVLVTLSDPLHEDGLFSFQRQLLSPLTQTPPGSAECNLHCLPLPSDDPLTSTRHQAYPSAYLACGSGQSQTWRGTGTIVPGSSSAYEPLGNRTSSCDPCGSQTSDRLPQGSASTPLTCA